MYKTIAFGFIFGACENNYIHEYIIENNQGKILPFDMHSFELDSLLMFAWTLSKSNRQLFITGGLSPSASASRKCYRYKFSLNTKEDSESC